MGNGASARGKAPSKAEISRVNKARPSDAQLTDEIERFADAVLRNGPRFEAMARVAQAGNPRFAFLNGGPGAGYYQHYISGLRGVRADSAMNKAELVLSSTPSVTAVVDEKINSFVHKIRRIPRQSALTAVQDSEPAVGDVPRDLDHVDEHAASRSIDSPLLCMTTGTANSRTNMHQTNKEKMNSERKFTPMPPPTRPRKAELGGVNSTRRGLPSRRISVSQSDNATASTQHDSSTETVRASDIDRDSVDGVVQTISLSKRLRRLSVQAQACSYDVTREPMPEQTDDVLHSSDDEMDGIERDLLRQAEQEAAESERENAAAASRIDFSENLQKDTAHMVRETAATRSKRIRRTSVIEMAAESAVSTAQKWMATPDKKSSDADASENRSAAGLSALRKLKEAAYTLQKEKSNGGTWHKFLRAVKLKRPRIESFSSSAIGQKSRAWADIQKKKQAAVEGSRRRQCSLATVTNTSLKTEDILNVLRDRAMKEEKSLASPNNGQDVIDSVDISRKIPDAWKRIAQGADLQVHEPSIWKKEDRKTGVKTWGRRVTRESMARSFESGQNFAKVRWSSMSLWLHDAATDFEIDEHVGTA